MRCPACEFIRNGGRPRRGRVCPECKGNLRLMGAWRDHKYDYESMRHMIRVVSIGVIILMLLLLSACSGNHIWGPLVNFVLWPPLLVHCVSKWRKYRRKIEENTERVREVMFLFRTQGRRKEGDVML